MFNGTIRRVGNSAVVTIPREEMERIGLQEGQTVSVEVRAVEVTSRPMLADDLREPFERALARSDSALRTLAG